MAGKKAKTIGPVAKYHNLNMEQLLEVGAHFGHLSRRWNPRMAEYLWQERKGVHIFDLEQTVLLLDVACLALEKMAEEGKNIVFVGTKRQARDMIKKAGEIEGVGYVCERWLGGTVTNWGQIKTRLRRLAKMKEDKKVGMWSRYTKKEQVLMDREIAKLEKFFGGIADLSGAPEVLVIVDVNREKTALREAKKRGLKTIALVDSNCDPEGIDYIIPVNDDSNEAVEMVLEALLEVVKRVKEKGAKKQKLKAEKETVGKLAEKGK